MYQFGITDVSSTGSSLTLILGIIAKVSRHIFCTLSSKQMFLIFILNFELLKIITQKHLYLRSLLTVKY